VGCKAWEGLYFFIVFKCVCMQQIPSYHLEGLYVWNSEDPEPVHTVFAAGSGLLNTDYVMYIQSIYTETCLTGVSDWHLF